MIQQDGDVLAALAQRRHLDVDDVEPVVEVLAEGLLGDVLDEATMGRGDHPDVDRRLLAIGSDSLNFAGLQKPQQQRLHPQAHLADFVHEDGAAVGGLEPAALVAVGVREAALHVAEQFRLEERVGDAGAVDR